MAETTTVNYGWTKPDPGASPNTWGATLNATVDKIDAKVFANEQGLSPIGGMIMFGGAVAPKNWLLCNGQSFPTTGGTYDALFAAIQYAHGGSGANFNVPNLNQRFPLGANPTNVLGSVGGALTATLVVANMPVHNHPVVDPTHNHTHNDPTHAHGVADPTHIHGVGDPGHAHGATASQDAHSHGLDHQVLTPNAGGNAQGAATWGFNNVRTDVQQPAVHVSIAGSGTGVYLGYAATGIGIYGAATGVTNNPAATGISIGNVGSATPVNITPPFAAVNFIIRYA